MSHIVVKSTESLTTGLVYTFKWRALNSIGYSDFSEEVSVALSDPPAKPSAPTLYQAWSSKTNLYIKWAQVSDGLSPGGLINGYQLWMDDGKGGDMTIIFNSINLESPDVREYQVNSLITGLPYRFQVAASNYNQVGELSDIASFQPCDLPSEWSKPTKVSTTSTTITVAWGEP